MRGYNLCSWLGSAALLLGNVCSSAQDTNALLRGWLDAQIQIRSWEADFIQTRSLKSLTQPLTATGHVYFAAPNRFRWELGHPPRTIAVRAAEDLLVIYPKLKHVERFPLTGGATGRWRDALALLEAGFPRSEADLQAQYHILAQTVTGQICELTLQPRSAAARQMMPQIKVAFDTKDFSLRATELEFADGSTMRNDFQNAVLNPKVDEQWFAPNIPPDYKIIEPLKK
ncbi:MAG: hypothetical protein C5B50_20995 [Verrucomicrobia bacterium]|nr:MAG: hypothetical protein C5B50_20995 [Verrucomicrobiota bacterium]